MRTTMETLPAIKTFTVRGGSWFGDRDIKGESLAQAITGNFGLIAEIANIGNCAGYILERVHVAMSNGFVGHRRGAEVTIMHRGQPLAFEPQDKRHTTKNTTVWIYCKPEDCPEPFDITLNAYKGGAA
jgi:hypothetical protein